MNAHDRGTPDPADATPGKAAPQRGSRPPLAPGWLSVKCGRCAANHGTGPVLGLVRAQEDGSLEWRDGQVRQGTGRNKPSALRSRGFSTNKNDKVFSVDAPAPFLDGAKELHCRRCHQKPRIGVPKMAELVRHAEERGEKAIYI